MELLNKLYEKGQQKVNREFSVERLIRSIREMKIYMKNQGFLTAESRLKIYTNPLIIINLDEKLNEQN
jgi:hypothetical protein